MKDELAWGTQKNYYTTQRYVYEFLQKKLKISNLYLDELNYKFIKDFVTNKNATYMAWSFIKMMSFGPLKLPLYIPLNAPLSVRRFRNFVQLSSSGTIHAGSVEPGAAVRAFPK